MGLARCLLAGSNMKSCGGPPRIARESFTHGRGCETFLTVIVLAARAGAGGVNAANQFGGLGLDSSVFFTSVPIDVPGVDLATGRGDGIRNAAFLADRERLTDHGWTL